MTTLFSLLLMTCFAKDLEPVKVDGSYRADRDANEPSLTLELQKFAVTGKLTSVDAENPSAPPSETALKGEYFITGDVVTMTFDRVKCKLKYKDDVEFYSGAPKGPGLELLPTGGKRPALCKNSFRKILK